MQRRLGDLRTGYQVAPATAAAAVAASTLKHIEARARKQCKTKNKKKTEKKENNAKKEQQLARTSYSYTAACRSINYLITRQIPFSASIAAN